MKKLCNYYYSLSKNNKNIGEQSIDIIRNGNEEFISIELFLIGKKVTVNVKYVDGLLEYYVKNTLELNGYNHYEISNFAKLGKESRHNLNCWNQEEYIQIEESQSLEDKKNEFMMLGFRKIQGVDIARFKEKFIDNPIFLYRENLNKLVEEGLIEVDLNHIKLTNKGIDLANLVFEEFVDDC